MDEFGCSGFVATSLPYREEAVAHGFGRSQWSWYNANIGPERRNLLVEWITNPRVTSNRTKYHIRKDYWPPNLFIDLEHVDFSTSASLEDEWGVYGIAGVTGRPQDIVAYFNYEGSARGCYSRQGHIGILARMHSYFDTLESSTCSQIVADRESTAARSPQYIHELCSRPETQFQVYKLASLPIIFDADVLRMQMKQLYLWSKFTLFILAITPEHHTRKPFWTIYDRRICLKFRALVQIVNFHYLKIS